MTTGALEAFEHRTTYAEANGRDAWIVRAIATWIGSTLPPLLASRIDGPVVDVGCGEQPFRAAIEGSGHSYIGMDVVQNSAGTVDIISSLDVLPDPWPRAECRYSLLLCTEVLEHVADIDAAFANLRRLTAPGGAVVVTTPFMFPLHMEPFDYRRLTVHGLTRLATTHGFQVERLDRLGAPADVAATLIADLSILPARRSPLVRAKVAMLRMVARSSVRWLQNDRRGRDIVINGNGYLGNGAVLRAQG
jgi:SAM-dependent methyltransferase